MKTVLIVDDNELWRYALKTALLNEYHIIEAVNGKEGVDMAINNHPDVIILDMLMPIMTGTEMIESLKEKGFKNLPLIILSTFLNNEDEKLNKQFNIEHCFNKTVADIGNIKNLIKKILNS